MKKILITIFILLSADTYGHDTDGFYVIPTGKVTTKEVCNGSPIGDGVFSVSLFGRLEVGSVYSTDRGNVVEVTGITDDNINFFGSIHSFNTSIDTLSDPSIGTRGPFFTLSRGEVIYVRFL